MILLDVLTMTGRATDEAISAGVINVIRKSLLPLGLRLMLLGCACAGEMKGPDHNTVKCCTGQCDAIDVWFFMRVSIAFIGSIFHSIPLTLHAYYYPLITVSAN